jgi:hypothetical protein
MDKGVVTVGELPILGELAIRGEIADPPRETYPRREDLGWPDEPTTVVAHSSDSLIEPEIFTN